MDEYKEDVDEDEDIEWRKKTIKKAKLAVEIERKEDNQRENIGIKRFKSLQKVTSSSFRRI